MHLLSRRSILKFGLAATALGSTPSFARARLMPPEPAFDIEVGEWRTFDITTTVVLPRSDGTTRLWLPVPTLENGFQRTVDNDWEGNGVRSEIAGDGDAAMLFAEFDGGEQAPTLTLTSRVRTKNRAVDWERPMSAQEDAAVLEANLKPTRLQPVEGIVRETAERATQGAVTDVDKVRALYEWIVSNCHREPTVPGCGSGDAIALLTSGGLGGKCADLNGLFVAMARSVGVPARDIYGVRVAPSAFGYRELGGNPSKLSGAQHCRAEVWLADYGWVAMDPADVLKVMRQEKPEWIKDLDDPLIAPINAALFGSWEGNWIGFNTARDIALPESKQEASPLPFLMYPQAENDSGRFEELAADKFSYAITAREITV
ncbi:transglutaminase domain-containing protein [Aquamicrobium sp. LC103]|uniref:transglutaminase-like domain-containing protein n=1 Tax=Aquamicrobium sp. LC103 TaxID=1120658 RepID=UPI00063EAF32|nr:transglutaminase domain-containing protein [Aquamicrobium sp. LC103]TKT75320.1 transglutaminase domain-containing protein [Aquamicrobium sp. LC103]